VKNAGKFIRERRNQISKGAKIFRRKVMTLQHWVFQLWPIPAWRYRIFWNRPLFSHITGKLSLMRPFDLAYKAEHTHELLLKTKTKNNCAVVPVPSEIVTTTMLACWGHINKTFYGGIFSVKAWKYNIPKSRCTYFPSIKRSQKVKTFQVLETLLWARWSIGE